MWFGPFVPNVSVVVMHSLAWDVINVLSVDVHVVAVVSNVDLSMGEVCMYDCKVVS